MSTAFGEARFVIPAKAVREGGYPAGRDAAMQGLRLAGSGKQPNSVSVVVTWMPAFADRVRVHDTRETPHPGSGCLVQGDRPQGGTNSKCRRAPALTGTVGALARGKPPYQYFGRRLRRRVRPADFIRNRSRDMISRIAKTLFFAAVIAGMGAAIPAHGAPLPPSGSTAYTGYFACHHLEVIDMGESGSQTVTECVGITRNISDPKLFDNMSVRCLEDGEVRFGGTNSLAGAHRPTATATNCSPAIPVRKADRSLTSAEPGNIRTFRSRELGSCITRRPSRRVNSSSPWSTRSSGKRSEKIAPGIGCWPPCPKLGESAGEDAFISPPPLDRAGGASASGAKPPADSRYPCPIGSAASAASSSSPTVIGAPRHST